jgi:hypothetical protein
MCHPSAEEAVHESAVLKLALELGLVVVPLAHRAEHAEDAGQDDDVQQRDQVQKRG